MKNNVGRRVREKAEMRLRILDAARELFVSGGEPAVTMRRVAAKIEYSPTSIYLHFPDKESLVEELCSQDFQDHCRTFQQAERLPDPMARLRKVAAVYVDFGILYPAHYRAMFMTAPGPRRNRTDQKPPAAAASPYDFLHTAVFKAMAIGCFKPEYRDVANITQVIWSGLHGVVSLHLVRSRYNNVSWRPAPASAEMMINCLLDGLTGKR